MEILTFCVGGTTALAVFCLPVRIGLFLYVATLLCYPDYLRAIVGGLTISASRLVVAALLVRCVVSGRTRRAFRWSLLDTLVVSFDLVCLTAMVVAQEAAFAGFKYRLGVMMDTTCAYFCARLALPRLSSLDGGIKPLLTVLVPLATFGVVEAATTASPYAGLSQYRFYADRALGSEKFEKLGKTGHTGEERHGFYRAAGPHGHPILFGLTFAIALPVVWGGLPYTNWRRARIPLSATVAAGALSSLSSGPLVGLLIALAGCAFDRAKWLVRPLCVVFALACIPLEFMTKRPHFYHALIARMAIDENTGYDRCRLIDAAIAHLSEYWLVGYGGRDPGWGAEVSGTDYTDVCIYYVFLATTYGLVGVCLYLACATKALHGLWRRYQATMIPSERSMLWALGVTLCVILGTNWAVTPYGGLPALYSVVLGVAGSAGVHVAARRRHVRPPARLPLVGSAVEFGLQHRP